MTEMKDLETALYLIERHCQPFLSQSGGSLIYRGIGGVDSYTCILPDILYMQPVRTDREPRNLPRDVHEILVKTFADLGFKANRNNVAFSVTLTNAKRYGTPYILFPIGDFHFTWSKKVEDLNDELKAFKSDEGYGWIDKGVFLLKDECGVSGLSNDEISAIKKLPFLTLFQLSQTDYINFNEESFKKHIEKMYLNSTDLVGAIESGNEIGIACKECYYMPAEHAEKVRGLPAS